MGSGEFSHAHRKPANYIMTTRLSGNCYLIKDITQNIHSLTQNQLNPLLSFYGVRNTQIQPALIFHGMMSQRNLL